MDDTPQLRIVEANTHYLDNYLRYQAQSVLVGLVDKPEPPDTIEQARDILSWANTLPERKITC